jgi:hypothetical protein
MIQQRPTVTPENKLNKKKKKTTLVGQIGTSTRTAQSRSTTQKKENHHQL